MNWLTPDRVDTEELLDEEDAPIEDVRQSLLDLRAINRYALGHLVYRRLLRIMVPDRDRAVSVLDLGTGTSDLVERLPYSRLRAIGLDLKVDHLLFGKELARGRVERVVGDVLQLPMRNESVDVVSSSHFFHHFSIEENVQILTESLRVARTGVIVTDTRRHLVPLAVVSLLGTMGMVGRITELDAPASVRRGYTIEEMRQIALRVPSARWRVVRYFPYRFGLLIWR